MRQYLNGNGLLSPLHRNCLSTQSNSAPGFTGNYNIGVTPMEQMPCQSHSISLYSTVPSPSSDAPAMSPALSSGATSASEVNSKILFIDGNGLCVHRLLFKYSKTFKYRQQKKALKVTRR